MRRTPCGWRRGGSCASTNSGRGRGRSTPFVLEATVRLRLVTSDEWRVEVDLDDEEHGFTFAERIRGVDLDEEARRRLGGSVTVTRDGPHMFLYATSEDAAREADRVVRELLGSEGLAGEVRL